MCAVVDTGVLVSGLIRRQGTTGDLMRALRDGRFTALINLIRLRGELVTPARRVAACRDPKDDRFLEAALAGDADCVVSGDADLLDLTPFENIPILRPAEFLARL